jgi:hypothetical protein
MMADILRAGVIVDRSAGFFQAAANWQVMTGIYFHDRDWGDLRVAKAGATRVFDSSSDFGMRGSRQSAREVINPSCSQVLASLQANTPREFRVEFGETPGQRQKSLPTLVFRKLQAKFCQKSMWL